MELAYPKVGMRSPNRSFSRFGRLLVPAAEESSVASLHTSRVTRPSDERYAELAMATASMRRNKIYAESCTL
jgi:hypothetical protein